MRRTGEKSPDQTKLIYTWRESLLKCRIVSMKSLGTMPSYNVTMSSTQHNYAIVSTDNKMIYSQNSHAAAYAEKSMRTAWLKAHYPTEFMAAQLTVELQDRSFDEVEKYERDCINNLGFTILPPDINKSKMHYRIIGYLQLMRPMLTKGIGHIAAEDIVKNQPYKGPDLLYSFAAKVGSAVNSKVVEAMYDAGLWGDNMSKKELLRKFETIKDDRRKGRGKPKIDLFH